MERFEKAIQKKVEQEMECQHFKWMYILMAIMTPIAMIMCVALFTIVCTVPFSLLLGWSL